MSIENGELEEMQPTGAENALMRVAVYGLFAMALMITINVVSRRIGRALIPDDVYLIQELMVLVILLPLGVVTATRQHISVDLFTESASRRGRLALSVLGHLVGLLFAGLLVWAGWIAARKAWLTQDYYSGDLNIPMWIGQTTFLIGLLLFLLRLVAMLYRDLRALL